MRKNFYIFDDWDFVVLAKSKSQAIKILADHPYCFYGKRILKNLDIRKSKKLLRMKINGRYYESKKGKSRVVFIS